MEKLNLHSPDLTARNVDKIGELFPNVITESRDADGNIHRAVDFDALRQQLSDHIVEGPQERYQLDWPGKRAAAFAANAPIAKTLRPVREGSVDFDTTKNIFIRGDNLEALKLLQEAYLGSVDVIYIDPPYNTGSDSFLYPDNYFESNSQYLSRSGQTDSSGQRLVSNTIANGRFHSDWLSMMLPRLKLARNLLADSGIIAISIGDDEVAQLRAVCDELFGEENRIAQITVEMSTTQGMKVRAAQNGAIVKNCEFLLIYARSSAHASVPKTPLFDPIQGWPGNFTTWLHSDLTFEPLADYLSHQPELTCEADRILGEDRVKIDDLTTLYATSTVFREFIHKHLENIAASDKGTWPANIPEPNWREGQAYRYEIAGKNYIVMKSSKGTVRQFLQLSNNFRIADDYARTYGRTVIRGDLWRSFYSDMAHVSLEGDTRFENGKKPLRLIENLVKWADNRQDILILDFFAGSGSTGHAAMRLNAADSGERRFILIQLDLPLDLESSANYTNINSVADLATDRIRRAGQKIIANNPGVDVGFRLLEVDTTNLTNVSRDPESTDQLDLKLLEFSIRAGRSSEDLLFQVLLNWGLELSLPIAREEIDSREVFSVDHDALIACFAETITSEVVRAIATRRPLRAVFRDDAFESDAARINAEQVFREMSPSTDVRTI
ncbi:site-specific DNA-methyltransferase [Gordonia sp. PP30]|uniref:site-specific DNA-methyltransferase n=1 Tax=unclassified Gordonia (in: high G+C Gram-positive bacteria) TaxID=2657482 RepID=UPI0020001E20|nr:site-specific DNA-methyltransferase [Gordonia sp. PP30]UQE74739.1 site-specific DNA-methyltransferase [Gordonia sp. PP30]